MILRHTFFFSLSIRNECYPILKSFSQVQGQYFPFRVVISTKLFRLSTSSIYLATATTSNQMFCTTVLLNSQMISMRLTVPYFIIYSFISLSFSAHRYIPQSSYSIRFFFFLKNEFILCFFFIMSLFCFYFFSFLCSLFQSSYLL